MRQMKSRVSFDAEHRINFYSAIDAYNEFSNFHVASFSLDKKVWPSAEHYFQAQKFH